MVNVFSRMHPVVKGLLVVGLAVVGAGLGYLVYNADVEPVEPLEPEPVEEYHADNDIVMTLRSVIDTFASGDTIAASDYQFNGVLTDGEGRPLYTDTSGGPGEWEVVVANGGEMKVSNLHLGDLMPGQLERYLIDNLGLTEETAPEPTDKRRRRHADPRLSEGGEVRTYLADGCRLEYYVRPAYTATGKEGPLVTVTLTSTN